VTGTLGAAEGSSEDMEGTIEGASEQKKDCRKRERKTLIDLLESRSKGREDPRHWAN
jgi:hypothetical protein